MGKSSKHQSKDLGDRKGWFEKNMDGNPVGKNYRDNCEGLGYNGPRWEAHHIVPKESIKQSIEGSPARPGSPTQGVTAIEIEGYADFFEDLKWVTPWNLDDQDNLVGMPHLNSFMMYFDRASIALDPEDPKLEIRAAEIVGAYMSQRIGSFNRKDRGTRKMWKGLLDKEGSPEGSCIHQYVNWGHTEYNRVVAKWLHQMWNLVLEERDGHIESPEALGVDPAQIAQALKNTSQWFRRELETRGENATGDNWAKGYRRVLGNKRKRGGERKWEENPDYDPTWYKNFTMADGWNPLTGTAS